MNAPMSNARINMLRLAYGKVQSVAHNSPAHHRIVEMVQRLPAHHQAQLEKSGIRWLAPVAFRIRTGDPFAVLPGAHQHVRDQGRGW